ncbi:MAG: type IV toxin-antitoxin system AbiEi family antitoxin domain-containing protein [bacterium]|nr:type IV toxin-antitoxin system AbiEi family antitoxin domain-containing protein [bacterium]
MSKTPFDTIIQMTKKKQSIRSRDLTAEGIPRAYLGRLVDKGLLIHESRGIYTLPDIEITELHDFAQAARQVPTGVICLLSALRFHNLTTQNPFEVWVAIGGSQWKPKIECPAIRFVRFSGTALEYGVEQHEIEGAAVRVYSPAKTIADCFKYRNKIGLDVALEALRDCWRQRKATMDDIWEAAKVCRVANVMRPYLESLT